MQIKQSTDVTVLLSSKIFLQQVTDYTKALETVSDSSSFSEFIKDKFTSLTTSFIAIGDKELVKIKELENSNIEEVYVLHFVISEGFKDVALLHRDVLLQLQIAYHNEIEGVVPVENIASHFEVSKKILYNALSEYIETILGASTAMYDLERKEKILSGMEHLTNPWLIYREQFETIQNQIKEVYNTISSSSVILKSFAEIRSYNAAFLLQVKESIDQLKKYSTRAIKMVKVLKDQKDIMEIVFWIDKTIQNVSNENTLQITYRDGIELKIKGLGKLSIPVETNNGLLLTKKVDFNKTVDKWFDFEVLPILIDLWGNMENMESYLKHSLYNFKMSLLLAKNNKDLESMPSQLQTLQNIYATIIDNEVKINSIIVDIENKFNTHFLFTKIYTKDNFLEVSLQSSISNFTNGRSDFLSIIKHKIGVVFLKFNKKYHSSVLFAPQNKVEHSIQTINYRMFKEDNAQYDTLFRNKNFIGDLFISTRTEQEATLQNSIEQWYEGFNKAILVTGDMLSGKSTFVEGLGEKNFKKRTIHLGRNSTLTFGGRKSTITRNLKEALQSIKKGLSSRKYMLVIDNLEYWKDDRISLLENTRALLSFIASESDNVLVLVTCSEQMQFHLDKRLRFSEAFSTKVCLNKASYEQICKAVLTRHGASHKQLVTIDHQVLTAKQIEHQVLKLCRRLNYNIGEVLQAWTYGTTIIDNNKVIYDDKDNGFKDFFNSEEIIILKYVFLYKNITEIELKNFVGIKYEVCYKPSLKRLTNIKVLLRQDDGVLKLNRVLAMDIKQILIYRGNIN